MAFTALIAGVGRLRTHSFDQLSLLRRTVQLIGRQFSNTSLRLGSQFGPVLDVTELSDILLPIATQCLHSTRLYHS